MVDWSFILVLLLCHQQWAENTFSTIEDDRWDEYEDTLLNTSTGRSRNWMEDSWIGAHTCILSGERLQASCRTLDSMKTMKSYELPEIAVRKGVKELIMARSPKNIPLNGVHSCEAGISFRRRSWYKILNWSLKWGLQIVNGTNDRIIRWKTSENELWIDRET